MKAIERLLLDSIDENYIIDEYNYGLLNVSMNSSPIKLVKSVFEREKNDDIKQEGYRFAAESWLRGLTDCINVPYMDFEILEFGYKSCILKKGLDIHNKEMAEEDFLRDYWGLLAGALTRMMLKEDNK